MPVNSVKVTHNRGIRADMRRLCLGLLEMPTVHDARGACWKAYARGEWPEVLRALISLFDSGPT